MIQYRCLCMTSHILGKRHHGGKRHHEVNAIMQVRTGTSKSTKGHRDPALTWEVPAPLQEGSPTPAQQVTPLPV